MWNSWNLGRDSRYEVIPSANPTLLPCLALFTLKSPFRQGKKFRLTSTKPFSRRRSGDTRMACDTSFPETVRLTTNTSEKRWRTRYISANPYSFITATTTVLPNSLSFYLSDSPLCTSVSPVANISDRVTIEPRIAAARPSVYRWGVARVSLPSLNFYSSVSLWNSRSPARISSMLLRI